MTQLEEVHVLPSDMRAGATGVLFDTMKAQQGEPLVLDASAVERMDTLAAQLFVIGAKSWAQDAQSFKIINPSEKVCATFERLGLSELINLEGAENAN